MDQRFGRDDAGAGIDVAHRLDGGDGGARTSWSFNCHATGPLARVHARHIAAAPGEEADLVDRGPERHRIGGVAVDLRGGAREAGEAVDERALQMSMPSGQP
jgi:hypothetical protein